MSVGELGERRCPWAPLDQADSRGDGPMYPQLRARAKGVSRARVIADQRSRIHSAMIEAVVRHGYDGASVAEVARLAGVSTRTVYERFGSKEGCLLETCDAITMRLSDRISRACFSGPPRPRDTPPTRDTAMLHPLTRASSAFAQDVARHPKEAAFLLVHAPTAGPAGFLRVVGAHALCADVLAAQIVQIEGSAPSPTLLLGLVRGVSHVSRTCLVRGRPERVTQMVAQLESWLRSGSAPLSDALESEPSTALEPSVLRQAPPTVSDPRARLPRIAAEIAARDGYRATSVARICEVGRVGIDDFMADYGSAEDCLRASRELLSAEALASALRGIRPRQTRDLSSWCAAVCEAIAALLRKIAEDPALQMLGFLEPLGPEGIPIRVATMTRFAEVLRRRVPASLRFQAPASDAVVGAFWGVVQHRLVAGEARDLTRLAAPLAYLILSPIVGAELAAAAASEVASGPEARPVSPQAR